MAPLPIWLASLSASEVALLPQVEAAINSVLVNEWRQEHHSNQEVRVSLYKVVQEIGAANLDFSHLAVCALIDSYEHVGWQVRYVSHGELTFSRPK